MATNPETVEPNLLILEPSSTETWQAMGDPGALLLKLENMNNSLQSDAPEPSNHIDVITLEDESCNNDVIMDVSQLTSDIEVGKEVLESLSEETGGGDGEPDGNSNPNGIEDTVISDLATSVSTACEGDGPTISQQPEANVQQTLQKKHLPVVSATSPTPTGLWETVRSYLFGAKKLKISEPEILYAEGDPDAGILSIVDTVVVRDRTLSRRSCEMDGESITYLEIKLEADSTVRPGVTVTGGVGTSYIEIVFAGPPKGTWRCTITVHCVEI